MRSLFLLASLFADSKDDPLQRPEVVWGVAGIAVALLAGAVVIYGVDKWRKRAAAGPTEGERAGALSSYRDMYENGEITEAEYAELRRRVAEKVKKPAAAKADAAPVPGERATLNPPAPPAPALPPPPEPPPPPSSA
jgi:hypothetical protein